MLSVRFPPLLPPPQPASAAAMKVDPSDSALAKLLLNDSMVLVPLAKVCKERFNSDPAPCTGHAATAGPVFSRQNSFDRDEELPACNRWRSVVAVQATIARRSVARTMRSHHFGCAIVGLRLLSGSGQGFRRDETIYQAM